MLVQLIAMLRHRGLSFALWTTAVCILYCAVDLNESTIVVCPENQCAIVGETIQFNCSTDRRGSDTIEWKRRALNGSDFEFIYSLGIVSNSFKRYEVGVTAETGSYNLIINKVMSEDAGTFRCNEKDSSTEFKDALLIVRGSVDCNGREMAVKQDSERCTNENTILGITATILAINIIFTVFGTFLLWRFLKKCKEKKSTDESKKTTKEEEDLNKDRE